MPELEDPELPMCGQWWVAEPEPFELVAEPEPLELVVLGVVVLDEPVVAVATAPLPVPAGVAVAAT